MNRKTGVLLSYVLMAFEVFSTLILTPFVIRSLGQAEYGVYKLALSLNAYLYLLDLGVGNTVTTYISRYRANGDKLSERKFIGICTVFYLVISILTVIVGMLLVRGIPRFFAAGLTADQALLAQRLLKIIVFNTAFVLLTAVFNNILIAYEKFSVSRSLSIVQIVLRIILVFTVLKSGMGAVGIVTVNLVLTVLFRSAAVVYAVLKLRALPKFAGISPAMIKETVTFSSFILLQMIATQINLTADQILIGALVSSSAVIIGIYGVATQICQYFQSIGNVFGGVLMPGIVRLVERKESSDRICDEMIKVGRIVLMACGMFFGMFIVFGKQFIGLWAGTANVDAYYVCLMLMTAYLFIMIGNVGMQVLYAMKEHREISVIKLIIVALNIIFTVILIRWKPLLGAAIGTFISLMLGDVVLMNAVFVKKIGFSPMRYYKGLMKGTVFCLTVAVAVGFGIKQLGPEGWPGLIVGCGLMCTVYFLLLWFAGMNLYEKNLLRRTFRLKQK